MGGLPGSELPFDLVLQTGPRGEQQRTRRLGETKLSFLFYNAWASEEMQLVARARRGNVQDAAHLLIFTALNLSIDPLLCLPAP